MSYLLTYINIYFLKIYLHAIGQKIKLGVFEQRAFWLKIHSRLYFKEVIFFLKLKGKLPTMTENVYKLENQVLYKKLKIHIYYLLYHYFIDVVKITEVVHFSKIIYNIFKV